MVLQHGVFVIGLLHGYVAEPWSSNGKSGTNHILCISRQFTDKFGQLDEEKYNVTLGSDVSLIKHVVDFLKEHQGEPVVVPVVAQPRGTSSKTWVSYFMPKNSRLQLLG